MDVFGVVAVPARRAILEKLAEDDGIVSAGELCDLLWDRFRLTQPSTSKHLRVLREAGLVVRHVRGGEAFFAPRTAPLSELAHWLERVVG